MAETQMNSYVNNTVGFVHTYILNPIVGHLNTKGVQVTLEELAGVLQMPAPRVAPAMPGPAVPGMAFGGAVPSMAPAITPTRKSTTTTVPAPIPGRSCAYQFKRGEHKGEFCGKPTIGGSDYCNTCAKNRKNLPKAAVAGMIPGAAPGAGGIPQGYAAPVAGTTASQGELSVVEYDPARGLYREPTHNFILSQNNDIITVLGKLVDNNIVGLTPAEANTAREIGMTVSNATLLAPVSTQPTAPAVTSTQATAPHAPAPVFAVPHAPAPVFAVPHAPAPVLAVPQVPQVPQLVAPVPMFSGAHGGIPSVPIAGQIPQMPQAHQVS